MRLPEVQLAPHDLEVDQQLAAVAAGVRFLLDVTPMDADEVRRRWVKGDHAEPVFGYREPSSDPDVLLASIDLVDLDGVEHEVLRTLLVRRADELRAQAEMLRARNTDRFRELSAATYGAVEDELLAKARLILDEVPLDDSPRDPVSDTEFLALAEAEIAWYQQQDPEVVMHAEIREDVSGVMVSGDTLLVPTGNPVQRNRANALLQHEVGTHLVTQVNGLAQQISTLGGGLANCDGTQEGLAVLGEIACGQLTRARLRQLAGRVVIVDAMLRGTGFEECWQHLVSRGFKPGSAFTTVMRIFRSGGFTKDACYLRGLVDLLAHVRDGGRLDLLFLGKFSLDDLAAVEQLDADGLLAPARLQPRWLAEGDSVERLARAAVAPLPELAA